MAETEYKHVEQREMLLNLADLNPAMHILDLGLCDCECISIVLAKRGFRVTAIDNGEYELRATKEYASKHGLLNMIDFHKEDAVELSFENDTFDVVIAHNLLHHCENLERVVLEMFRVCKTGGKIIVSDFNDKGRRLTHHLKDTGFLARVERLITQNDCEFEKFDLDFTRVWKVTPL